jgi:hypothetical protein
MRTISLSCCTVTRHIGKFGTDSEQGLRDGASEYETFSLLSDESMDEPDADKLVVYAWS